jgi:hypothetical protein
MEVCNKTRLSWLQVRAGMTDGYDKTAA